MSSENNSQGSSNPSGSSTNSTELKQRSRDAINQILLHLDADCSGIPATVEEARACQIVHPSLLRFPDEESQTSQTPEPETSSGANAAATAAAATASADPSTARRAQHPQSSVGSPYGTGGAQLSYPSVVGPFRAEWAQSASSDVAGPSTAGWPQQERRSSNVARPSTAGGAQQRRAPSNVAGPSTAGAVQPERGQGTSASETEVVEREPKRRRTDERANYTCPACQYSTPYRKMMDRHEARHADSRCYVCDIMFATTRALSVHNNIHHGNTTPLFVCEYCERPYTRKASLQNHIRDIHPLLGEFGCPHCAQRFSTRQGLHMHVYRKHPTPSTNMFVCEVCGRHYRAKNTMLAHVRRSHGGT
ncbi:Telomere zinc finger-associated protein [Gracilariopsis chorda]|uniref:Telomere zinc finger-associated protein n=1 Tax=Gracilariopsis chorda TaxID=448386 RepID=A0A2V3J0B0_9FLOR|nr:Telomere zinc finger-associated protein [Gracilariopsis chorda]|eukprot:PXF47846.1 Telomere zinc finger-associated protein [Gracilariopsis chorda]